jgi:3'-phosphoadenosine 5'-phosphosulfate (PAPS) 3'-phosphatase
MPLVTSSTIDADLRQRLLAVGLADGGMLRSVGIKVGELVTGAADVYVSHHPVKFWDSCAPLVVLWEAGGVATHLDGTPFSFTPAGGSARHAGGPFVISNATRHEPLRQAFVAAWSQGMPRSR